MNVGDLLEDENAGDPFGRQPVEGIIERTPASADELLLVSVPSVDGDLDATGDLMPWSGPRDRTLPNAGDRCLVVYTKDGTAWVAAWQPS